MTGKDLCKTGNDKKLQKALFKKAFGYDAKEVTEEYALGEDGEVKLLKKKVAVKNVPPDLAAIKFLLEENGLAAEEMSDEELFEERDRLLLLLKENAEKDKENGKIAN